MLGWTAFGLRALGRLREAKEPMEAGLGMRVEQENWSQAALEAGNLSELVLTLGDVSGAMVYGEAAVAHADKSGDDFEKLKQRSKLADVLHQAGRFGDSGRLFREAEEIQRNRQPQFHFLYSLMGYQYCDLLLNQAYTKEAVEAVVKRAEQTLEWIKHTNWLLDIALGHLTLGRAYLKLACPSRPPLPTLDQAVEGLRKAGTQHMLPFALLARAACHRAQGDFQKSLTDLTETREIAEAGEMKLHLIDYHLEYARLLRDQKKEMEMKEHLEIAERMIAYTGYHRRDKELEELKTFTV
jgi:tetratricopeptide (TPR) repeat protein